MSEVVGTAVVRVEVDNSAVDGGVQQGIDQASKRAKTGGDTAGKNYGDAFAKALGTKLDSALKALPGANQIKLTADSSAATREILAVKGELIALSNQEIGVDLSISEAEAKLATIRAELTALSKSPDTQISFDASTALKSLTDLDKELNQISDDGKKAGGKGPGGDSEGMGALITAAITLGPALIPIAAAAAPAFGAIVLGAGSAALALKGAQAEIKAGTQAGQEFSESLNEGNSDLQQLEKTAATGVLTGFRADVEVLNDNMPLLNKEVALFSGSVGEASTYLVQGLFAGLKAAAPLLNEIDVALVSGAKSFDTWASNGGFNNFLLYVETEGPQVVATVKSLGETAVTLVKAIAPIGGGSLTAIKLLSEAINNLPLPVAEAFATIAATGFGLKAGFDAISNVTDIYTDLKEKIESIIEAKIALAAADKTEQAAATEEAVTDSAAGGAGAAGATEGAAVKGLSGGLSGAVAGLGALGISLPVVGIAVAGVTASVIAGTMAWEAHAKTVRDNQAAEDSLTQALIANNGALDDNGTHAIQQQSTFKDAKGVADQYGISADTLTQAIAGNGQALAQVNAVLDTNSVKSKEVSTSLKVTGGTADTVSTDMTKLSDAVEVGTKKYNDALAAQQKQAAILNTELTPAYATSTDSIQALDSQLNISSDTANKYLITLGYTANQIKDNELTNQEYTQGIKLVTAANLSGSDSTVALAKAMAAFSTSEDGASDRAALLGQYLVTLQGDALGYTGSMAGAYAANQNLITSWDAAQKSSVDFTYAQGKVTSASIDYTKQGAGPLVEELQAMQTAAENAAEATYKHELATKGGAQAASDAADVFKNQTLTALEGDAKQLGLTTAQADALAQEYFGMPDLSETTVKAIGLGDVVTALDGLGQQLSYLTHVPWTTTINANDEASGTINTVAAELRNLVTKYNGTNITVNGRVVASAEGNIFAPTRAFANGGENHTAHISTPVAHRVFSEPETGGEAYIPLSTSKRGRSKALLSDVANRFGMQVYADGGGYNAGSAPGSPVSDPITGAHMVAMVGAINNIASRPVVVKVGDKTIAKASTVGAAKLARRT